LTGVVNGYEAGQQNNSKNRGTVKMKSAGLAAVLSFFIPGLGQIYNGQILKGLVLIVIDLINAALMLILIGYVTHVITIIYAVYDAYKTAERINERRGGSSSF
jgi:TM2 domain-containing membrane protein YozV